MKVFVSYAFNAANNWVADRVIPLVKTLGFEVVTGQRMEGEVLIDGVDDRLRSAVGCIAFTTRRNQRADGSYETHPWVISEMTRARTLKFKTVEIREDGVKVGDEAEAYVRLRYVEAERDRMLIELAGILGTWVVKPVRLQLLPPKDMEKVFTGRAIRGDAICKYQLRNGGQIKSGETIIQPYAGGFFIEIEMPPKDAIVTLEVNKPNDNGRWMSFGDALIAIPVQLHDT